MWVFRLSRRRVLAGVLVLAVVAGLVTWAAWPAGRSWRTEARMLPVGSGQVALDTTFYLPTRASAADPVPAVLLAHGFGGSKASMVSQAEDLARQGYAVLTWTAEGFGDSGGQIHMDSPDYEVRDAQRLLDWLAARPEVRKDGPGDPRVGVVGASYGGALALLLAGYDRRVDAIVPTVTWNDLVSAFLPNGVFKKGWAGTFFGGSVDAGRANPQCGRFAPDVCQAFLRIATTGRADPDAVALLRRSSPSSVLDRITAPTLLIQGEADTLFPLSEADANARGIAANGTPVRVAWYTGGHDGGRGPSSDQDRVKSLTRQWLGSYLKGAGKVTDSFTWSRITGLDAVNQGPKSGAYSISSYPGLNGTGSTTAQLAGGPQQIANPPDGTPAAISSLPFASALSSAASRLATDIPGQYAQFESAPLSKAIDVVGAPWITIRAPRGAVLFVKLYDDSSLPAGQVAPIRMSSDVVTVTLPAIVHRFEAGHRLRLVVATSDQAYATPAQPAVYTVALAGTGLVLPTVAGQPIANAEVAWRWALAGLVAALVIGLVVVILVARRRRPPAVDPQHTETPLVVRGLRKAYADGFVAVSNVDFNVQRGQVVGLLGPNGAGKTTTLRVLLGLTRPTEGEVLVFGHRLVPGAPVLSRLGALVEGPGFLPHLSGLVNLQSYWRATGRPAADARLDEAVQIAGLGDAIHRRVRTYSHGMRQRLAIAQAMLGLPELLVLDEPTDGLDPPQIAEMRRVLKRYATGGRAVLVSSHLLAEVEQTCTHVVVVHKGEVVAAGPVGEIVGDSPTVVFDVSDNAAASAILSTMDGVTVAVEGPHSLVATLNGTPRQEAVAALVQAGVGVDRVMPRRRLEDAFLALVGTDSRGSGDR